MYKPYLFYGKELAKRLGEYCSYCEMPLSANLAVEHMVAKALGDGRSRRAKPKYTPTKIEDAKTGGIPRENADPELQWENFLLACPNCNSTKGSRIGKVEELAAYVLPTQPTSFGEFQYRAIIGGKCDDRPAGWKISKDWRAAFSSYVWTGFQELSFEELVLEDDVRRKVKVEHPDFRILVVPLSEKAANSCSLLNLNRDREDDRLKVRDRRIDFRSQVGRRAIHLAAMFRSEYKTPLASEDFPGHPAIEQIAAAAVAAGFWSVWVSVFRAMLEKLAPGQASPADPARARQWRAELLEYMFGRARFPGTSLEFQKL